MKDESARRGGYEGFGSRPVWDGSFLICRKGVVIAMYEKVSTDMNFIEREKAVERFWEDNDIFKKSMKIREGCPTYMFYDGPPTANGKPHIGHVLTRVIKDMIPRYRTMKGYMVPRKAGWDTHGLPVEIEVEKKLGLDGKEQIEQFGMAPFIEKCKESVWQYKGMWENFSGTVGFWADMENPYVTYHNSYIESEWWALKEIWNKGLLYKGYKIVPYCPRCGTPLSSHEVAQGYKDVKEKSCIAKFRLVDHFDEYILAWTTTPWTLPSNVALCVNADYDYVKIRVGVNAKGDVVKQGEEDTAVKTEYYYLAEELLSVVEGSYEIVGKFKGKDLEYTQYEPLFSYAFNNSDGSVNSEANRDNIGGKKAFFVVCDDYVTLTDGTGVVHIAPAFGEDDAKVGRKYDLPFVQLVDEKGDMKPEAVDMAGLFCKKADEVVMRLLGEKGQLFKVLKFEHSYPFCWRCDTPLIYYARESWFIRMTKVKDRLIENNNTINWIPESIGKGRFGDWLENVQDWGLSRNRYWGTPLNIWQCECGHMHSVGSIAELKELSDNYDEVCKKHGFDEIELHRPYIDEVTFRCEKCGKEMHRVPEVIDCWFDSGAMPFAQHHYPFENQELFEKQFPADFISEAVDQTRGWFYSLLAISTLLFDKAPYKNVIVLGLVQDENGQKMSKSKGNAVDPFDALNKFGADAIRWYFYINSAPWLPNRFHDKIVSEGKSKFMGTLWNTYAFFVLYANIDNFDATKYQLEYEKLSVMDKWLLSKLNTVVKAVDDNLANYRIPETARALQDFVDEMSNWYVRRGRERFWAKGMEQDKINAYMTLYTALVTISKAAAPMIPFMTEQIYRNLVCSIDKTAPESIHLCDFPVYHAELVDEELEKNMEQVLEVVVLGRAGRNAANLKQRQPVATMYVKSDKILPEFYIEIIEDELNVKSVRFTNDVRAFTSYSFKPQLKTLGKRFGGAIGTVKQILAEIDGNTAMDEINASGHLTITVNGTPEVIEKEDLLIEAAQTEGFVSNSDNGIKVVIDTTLTPELIEEGYVREVISKVQTMRKEADFEVMDHITVYEAGNDTINKIMQKNESEIRRVVLADAVIYCTKEEIPSDAYGKDWNLNGEEVVLAVKR